MKKSKFLALMLLPLSFVFFSCSEDEADYSKAKTPTTDQVFFSNEAPTEYLLEYGQNSVTIPVNRLKTDGPLTVQIVSEASAPALEGAKSRVKKAEGETTGEGETEVVPAAEVFTVPAEVTFAEGSNEAQIKVDFDFENLIPETDYFLTLKVVSDQNSEYGDIQTTVDIKYAPWSEPEPMFDVEEGPWAKYTYTQYASGTYDQDVYISENLLNPDQVKYILTDWFYGVDLEINMDKSKTIPGTNYIPVSVPIQASGLVNTNYGMVYVADSYTYWKDYRGSDVTFEQVPSYYMPDQGRFVLNVAYFVTLGYFGYGEEYLQMPGYESFDYSIDLSFNSNFITPDDKEGAIIDLGFGEDVVSAKYAIFKGELTEEEREAAADDIQYNRVEAVTTSEEGAKQFYLEEEGVYTIVAVAYDEDNKRQDISYLTFEFAPLKGWSNVWIGDFTYTQFFAEYDSETKETTPYVDEGLYCQQNDEDPTSFRIKNWGYGTDFKFSFEDGGDVVVAYQPIGYEEEGMGPVYVCDLYDYTGNESIAGKSSYDDETGLFTFVVYYPIVGTQYSYGYGAEYYQITDAAVKARVDAAYHAAKARAPKAKKKDRRAVKMAWNVKNMQHIHNNLLLKDLKLKQ